MVRVGGPESRDSSYLSLAGVTTRSTVLSKHCVLSHFPFSQQPTLWPKTYVAHCLTEWWRFGWLAGCTVSLSRRLLMLSNVESYRFNYSRYIFYTISESLIFADFIIKYITIFAKQETSQLVGQQKRHVTKIRPKAVGGGIFARWLELR